MNPLECYLKMNIAMREADFVTAKECAIALKKWLDNGGYIPFQISENDMRVDVTNVLNKTSHVGI